MTMFWTVVLGTLVADAIWVAICALVCKSKWFMTWYMKCMYNLEKEWTDED